MNLARWVNVAAGTWLFVSGTFLPSSPVQKVVQCLLGATVFLFAITAMADGRFRRINTVIGAAIVLAPFVLGARATPASDNRVLVGLVILFASLWPSRPAVARGVGEALPVQAPATSRRRP